MTTVSRERERAATYNSLILILTNQLTNLTSFLILSPDVKDRWVGLQATPRAPIAVTLRTKVCKSRVAVASKVEHHGEQREERMNNCGVFLEENSRGKRQKITSS